MANEAEEYWRKFEVESGEKPGLRSMGMLMTGAGRNDGTWGILVLTERSFRWRYVAGDPLFAGLFRGQRTIRPKDAIDELVIPLSSLVEVEMPRRGALARLFGSSWSRFTVRWTEDGATHEAIFDAEPSIGIDQALAEHIPDRPGIPG